MDFDILKGIFSLVRFDGPFVVIKIDNKEQKIPLGNIFIFLGFAVLLAWVYIPEVKGNVYAEYLGVLLVLAAVILFGFRGLK